jgi:hypothetical protein
VPVLQKPGSMAGGAVIDFEFSGAAALHDFCEGCWFFSTLFPVMLKLKTWLTGIDTSRLQPYDFPQMQSTLFGMAQFPITPIVRVAVKRGAP